MDIVDPRVDPVLVPEGSRAVVIAEQQDQYENLPAIVTPDGQVITRWALSDAERKAVLLGEDVFVTLISHGPINPMFVTVGPVNWRA